MGLIANRRSKPDAPPGESAGHTGHLSAAEQVDRELAAAALEKRRQGIAPTARELGALRRVERERDERERWRHYRTIPQRHWRTMSGRQAKVINDQAATYGIPFGGAEIDLPAVVRALHDFLADNARRLAGGLEGAASVSATGIEVYRRERAKMARLERRRREGELIDRAKAHEDLGHLAAILRRASETLARRFGEDAQQVLEDALLLYERELDARFGPTVQ